MYVGGSLMAATEAVGRTGRDDDNRGTSFVAREHGGGSRAARREDQ